MYLNVYVNFNGNAEEALEFYRSVLGGELDLSRYAGTPAESMVSSEWHGKVIHGRLTWPNGALLMASDATKEHVRNPGDNFSLSVSTSDDAEAERFFAGLSQGGSVIMPLAKPFWGAEKFGMLVDKFGIRWMVSCDKEAS